MRTNLTKKAFTLVELVVVIAIIAILTTVTIVGYNTFVKDASKSKAEQELTQLQTALVSKSMLQESDRTAMFDKDVNDEDNTVYQITLDVTGNTITFVVSPELDENDDEQTILDGLFAALLSKLDLDAFSEVKLEKIGPQYFLTHDAHDEVRVLVSVQYE